MYQSESIKQKSNSHSILMGKLIPLLLLFVVRIATAQSDNYLNWRNEFPRNAEDANNKHIYCDNIKLSYEEALLIKSTGGSKNVSETELRKEDAFVNKHIYDADVEMKFMFKKGATPEAAVGMAFETYPGGRVITFRFLLSADGHFYSHVDSASYSEYKKELRQFKSKSVVPKLLIDGSENKLVFARHTNFWKISINDQLVDSVLDSHYFPFNPANGIKFLFAGKFTLQLNSLKEDYALFQNNLSTQLKKVKQAEGKGYRIEDLNSKSNNVIDTNASVTFEIASGDIQANITSPVFGGVVKIRIDRKSDGTYEKNETPVKIGEYELVEFTLNPVTKNWYLKAEKKDLSFSEENTDFVKTERTTTKTSTLWYRGTKK